MTSSENTEGSESCPECGSQEVSTNTDLDAHVCRNCDHRWADSTSAERALRLAISGDEVDIEGVGSGLTVDYVSAGRDVVSARGEETTYRAELDADGSVTVTDIDSDKVVESETTLTHERDSWAA